LTIFDTTQGSINTTKKENHQLKMIVAEKELLIRVQNELLKKTFSKKSIRLSVAQTCISEGIRANLVLKICQISRSSYYYKPHIEDKKAGKSPSPFTKKLTGSYDNDSVVIEEIIKLLALPFVDYGYLKTTTSADRFSLA